MTLTWTISPWISALTSIGRQHTKQSSVYIWDSEGSINSVILSQQYGQVPSSSKRKKDIFSKCILAVDMGNPEKSWVKVEI